MFHSKKKTMLSLLTMLLLICVLAAAVVWYSSTKGNQDSDSKTDLKMEGIRLTMANLSAAQIQQRSYFDREETKAMRIETSSDLKKHVAEEVSKYKGIAIPVRVSWPHRKFRKTLPLEKIHPNPADEFCFPEIGPNDSIISGYVKDFCRFREDNMGAKMVRCNALEPIQVEKIKPDGYMILNGHHRWAAAMRAGQNKIAVEIVNLTQQEDVLKVLTKVRNKQRVTLDLDEVVLASGDCPTEKPPRFLWNRLYPERIRLGIPSLFWTLQKLKCDVWVYSSQLLSDDHIRNLFSRYHVHGVHVITGIHRKGNQEVLSGMEKKIFGKYPVTYHIDLKTVLKVNGATREFQEFDLPGKAVWSAEVLDIFRKQAAHG